MTIPDGDSVAIRILSEPDVRERIADLSAILIDCVEGGASIGFMAPLARARADAFWGRVADGVASGERTLLVAEEPITGELFGTVQLVRAAMENQPHRADVAKMLVSRAARRRGVGARLMQAVESAARRAGRTVLVLDTVTGSDADRLYTRLGWTRVGEIPDYALWPDGRRCPTTFFYKRLSDGTP